MSTHCVALLSNTVSLSNSSSVKSNVVAEYLAPTVALVTNDPELLNLTTVPNCVLPVKCGQAIFCVCLYIITPISANVSVSNTDNDNLFPATAKLTSTSDIINLPATTEAVTLVTEFELIAFAAAVALPIGNVTANPFNNIVLGVVILQTEVPMIVPYLSPPLVYL